jgi:hypothetical protein
VARGRDGDGEVAVTRPTHGGGARLQPVHTGLPAIASERFDAPLAAHRLVTFLNRTLKARGLVFGVRREGEGGAVVLTVYDTTGGDGRHGDGDGDGHDRGAGG